MKPSEMIFFGRSGLEDTSGHRNPCIKLVLLLLPLVFVIYQQVGRLAGWPRLNVAETSFVGLVVFAAIVLNFGEKEVPGMVKRLVGAFAFFGGLFIVVVFPKSSIAAILGIFSKLFSAIPILGRVAPESWLYVSFFFVAIYAVRSFTSRDTLWFGRRGLLWWGTLFTIYVILITTFCVINSALPLRFALSWRVASDKAMLARNPYQPNPAGWAQRTTLKWRLFALTLFSANSGMAQAIHLLCEQRGFFRRGYRDVIASERSIEDVVAVVLLMIGAMGLAIFRLYAVAPSPMGQGQ